MKEIDLEFYDRLFKAESFYSRGRGQKREPKRYSNVSWDFTGDQQRFSDHSGHSSVNMTSPPTRLPGSPWDNPTPTTSNSFFPDDPDLSPTVFAWCEGEGPRPINRSPAWSPIYKEETPKFDDEGLLGQYNGPLILSPPPYFENENGFFNFPSTPTYNSSPATELSSTMALSEISDLIEALNLSDLGGFAFDPANYLGVDSASGTENNSFGWTSPQPESKDNAAFPACLDIKQTLEYISALDNIRSMDGSLTHIQQLLKLLRHHLVFLTSQRRSRPNSSSQGQKIDSLERAAMFHRESAAICKPSFTWSGQLPPRVHRNTNFSCKVFVGGIPWDLTDSALQQIFKPYGNIIVQWPGNLNDPNRPKGFTYIIFESEKQVKNLIANCSQDYSRGGEFYHHVVPKGSKGKVKDAQIIPWASSDSNFVKSQTAKLDSKLTIFVGAIHGVVNAEGLARVMNDLFDDVVYAGIDLDKFKYPIGSGRVTFGNEKSFLNAVAAAFVEIKSGKVNKKVQVDPYLEDATCSHCELQQGPYFCRDFSCFRYFCKSCFKSEHRGDRRNHKPLTRNEKEQHRLSSSALCSPEPRGNRGYGRSGSMSRGNNMWNKSTQNNLNKVFKGNGPRC